eukprot:scaffold85549_cov24-Tisochrysis_lutea.AAC.3
MRWACAWCWMWAMLRWVVCCNTDGCLAGALLVPCWSGQAVERGAMTVGQSACVLGTRVLGTPAVLRS